MEVLGLTENRYFGIPTIKPSMQNAGKPEPEFYDDGLEFKVILRKAKKNNGIDSLDIKEAEKKEENAHSGSVLDKAAMLLEFCGTPKFR